MKIPLIDSAHNTSLFIVDEKSRLTDCYNARGLKLKYSKLVENIVTESKLKKNYSQ